MSETIDSLNVLLSSLMVQNQNAHNFHWNVEGADFFQLHEKLDETYEKLNEFIDMVAEQVRILGSYPKSTLKEFIDTSLVAEAPVLKSASDGAVIVRDGYKTIHDLLVSQIESKTLDPATEDLYIEVLRFVDKEHWMFNAYVS